MKINYNLTGAGRKPLIAAISQELNTPSKYLGMPSVAYTVGEYHIDKNGTVSGPDNRDLVADLQGIHGFVPASEEYDAPLPEAPEVPAFEDLNLSEREELGLGHERHDHPGEDGMQTSDVPDPVNTGGMTVEIPLEGFTPEKLDNLMKLVSAKAPLLKSAIGADDLPIQQTADTLRFPWFGPETDLSNAEKVAYIALVSMLCKIAKEKKRVTAKEKPVDGSPKYAMRCFLLSLGFIGDEHKTLRKILLSRLEGSAAWKNDKSERNATC